MRARASLAVSLAAIVALALTACAGVTDAAPSPHPILASELPSDLTARGVLLAAVLLSDGDVEQAVADGLVTPAEVDEAIRAIEAGELDVWAQRAETELADD